MAVNAQMIPSTQILRVSVMLTKNRFYSHTYTHHSTSSCEHSIHTELALSSHSFRTRQGWLLLPDRELKGGVRRLWFRRRGRRCERRRDRQTVCVKSLQGQRGTGRERKRKRIKGSVGCKERKKEWVWNDKAHNNHHFWLTIMNSNNIQPSSYNNSRMSHTSKVTTTFLWQPKQGVGLGSLLQLSA